MSAYSGSRSSSPAVGAHSAIQAPTDGRLTRAVRNACALAAILRGRDRAAVQAVVDPLGRDELVDLLVAACAMLPAHVDAEVRLRWIDLEPVAWSDALLAGEASRWDGGDRDATARMAIEESARRLEAMQRRAS
jgi:hypothetical protein